MEFDDAKENIQPLAAGRNVSILHAALNSELHEELLNQRKEYEKNIQEYEGNDPLQVWFDYILWIEQSYPSGGKESGLDEVIRKCLVTFENEANYRQDRRFIKLYIKFIDSNECPQECYQELYNQGIGTMVADLYICWAYYYDLSGNFKKANNIFQLGLRAKAQPFDELELAHKQFGFQMSQRILYDDEISQQKFMSTMQERRHALTSLRSHKKKVGSIRTGSVIKSHLPGKVNVDQQKSLVGNKLVHVFNDENGDPNAISEPPDHQVSIVRTLIDSARKQENCHEPGPWSKAHDKKKGKRLLTSTHELGFNILEDDSDSLPKIILKDHNKLFEKGIQLPNNFVRKNEPQSEWVLPVTTENEAIENTFPKYEKFYLYPKPNLEYSLEEYEAYKWWKKHSIENDLTKKYDVVWGNNVMVNARVYPNFSKTNLEQPEFKTNKVQLDGEQHSSGLAFKVNEIYPENSNEEFQFEEVLYKKVTCNERKIKFDGNQTIAIAEQMEETIIDGHNVRRKSFFPSKKSLSSFSTTTKKFVSPVILENLEENESEESDKPSGIIYEQNTSRRSVIIHNPLKNATSESCKEAPKELLKPNDPKMPTDNQPTIEPIQIFDDKYNFDELGNSFQFIAPVPPKIGPVNNKIPFEIYQECDDTQFEANETCSTQMFNCFIKAQSVSTPKNVQKPVVHFTNVPEPKKKIDATNHYQSTTSTNAFSPTDLVETMAAKGLSTIMETSETANGGTVSTKSSVDTQNGSPEFDLEISKFGQHNYHSIKIPTDNLKRLEPIKETAMQKSDAYMLNNITKNLNECQLTDKKLESGETRKLNSSAANNVLKFALRSPDTKLTNVDVSLGPFMSALNLETPTTRKLGNVSRIEQLESTIPQIKPIQIYEDKTETVPKVLLAKRPFVEGTPSYHTKFGGFLKRDEENSSILTMKPLKLFEDKTETVDTSKSQECEAEKFVIFEDKMETIPKIKFGVRPASCNDDEEEEMLELFSKTPPISNNKIPTCPVSSKKSSEISMNFSNLNDFTLSKPKPPTLQQFDLSSASFFESDEFSAPKPKIKCVYNSPDLRKKISFTKTKFTATNMNTSKKVDGNSSFMPSFTHDSFNVGDHVASGISKTTSNLSFMANFDISKIITPANDTLNIFDTKATEKLELNKSEEHNLSSFSILKSLKSDPVNPVDIKKKFNFNVKKDSNQSKNAQMSSDFFDPNIKKTHSDNMEHQSKFSIFKECSANISERNRSICFDASIKPEDFFEDNIRTDAFAPNVASIQNSTWLPSYNQQIQEERYENINSSSSESLSFLKKNSIPQKFNEISPCKNTTKEFKIPFSSGNPSNSVVSSQFNFLLKGNESNKDAKSTSVNVKLSQHIDDNDDESDKDDDLGRSIYYNHSPKTPLIQKNNWHEDDDNISSDLQFEHPIIDLDRTQQVIDEMIFDYNTVPFNNDLNNAFLDKIEFTQYINKLPTCQLIYKIKPIKKNGCTVQINDYKFNVTKLVDEGTYGSIFLAQQLNTSKKYAMKQERPANQWEYYICLEIQSRIQNIDILPAFMNIEYALIGNNASILVSEFSNYGSLITVCNKIKSITMKSLDEYVVMHLTSELLSIIDHLHASCIIHADIKADNFLLMKKLSYIQNEYSLQLIDFGVSVDMAQYREGQTFTYKHNADDFKCPEMRENRPWSYQLDLFGLAGVIHVLLFTKYMDIEKTLSGWRPKSKMPRYFHKNVWETIFSKLLNIRDSNSMPNLQDLRSLVLETMAEKEKFVKDKLHEFNFAINQNIR